MLELFPKKDEGHIMVPWLFVLTSVIIETDASNGETLSQDARLKMKYCKHGLTQADRKIDRMFGAVQLYS